MREVRKAAESKEDSEEVKLEQMRRVICCYMVDFEMPCFE